MAKTLAVPRPEREENEKVKEVAIRIEESIEEFLTLHLPIPVGEKLEMKPLWSNSDGSRFFRCNYQKMSDGCYVGMPRSFFVRVDQTEAGNVFVNMSQKSHS